MCGGRTCRAKKAERAWADTQQELTQLKEQREEEDRRLKALKVH